MADIEPPPFAVTTALTHFSPVLTTGTPYFWAISATDGISMTDWPLWSFTTVRIVEHRIHLPLVLHEHWH